MKFPIHIAHKWLRQALILACIFALSSLFLLPTQANISEPRSSMPVAEAGEEATQFKASNDVPRSDQCSAGKSQETSRLYCREDKVNAKSAAWLFLSALVGFVFLINKRS